MTISTYSGTGRRPGAARTAMVLAALVAVGGCGDGSGELSVPELTPDRPSFDGAAALALVDTQLAFGPRVPGTAGHQAQLLWMTERLQRAADTVILQPFTHVHSETGEELQLTNVFARFLPEAPRRLLFLAHWDTRPTSDQEETPEARALPVPGANDGGSGTAVLLHLADLLAEVPPDVGVDLLLVDGEDYGPTTEDMFLGARYFARDLPDPRPDYGVLLDMVGDVDPRFPVEGYSSQLAGEVAERVWGVAHALGYQDTFPFEVGQRISDDHLPLNNAGLPTVNVIDFDYGPGNAFWHTQEDDMDNISASSLEMVGEVVMELIFQGG
ncbi:MAG: M28 family peptidase [Gemmatimonadota bacterium]